MTICISKTRRVEPSCAIGAGSARNDRKLRRMRIGGEKRPCDDEQHKGEQSRKAMAILPQAAKME